MITLFANVLIYESAKLLDANLANTEFKTVIEYYVTKY